MLQKATDIYKLHQEVFQTIQEDSEVLKQLREFYAKDTTPGVSLSRRAFQWCSCLLFRTQCMNDCVFSNNNETGQPWDAHKQPGLKFYSRSKKEEEGDQLFSRGSERWYDIARHPTWEKIAGFFYCSRCYFLSSYTQTLTDVQEHFRVHAEKEMRSLFLRMKYDKCNKALHRAINNMAGSCGHLKGMGTRFANTNRESLSTMSEGPAIEWKVNQHATSCKLRPHMWFHRQSHISVLWTLAHISLLLSVDCHHRKCWHTLNGVHSN